MAGVAGPSILVKLALDLAGMGESFKKVGDAAGSAASKMHDTFSGVLGALNQTGVLGPFGSALDGVDKALDTIAKHAKDIGPAMMGVGAGLVGIGVGLQAVGSKDQAAHQQLQASIEATGKDYEDFGQKIEGAIKHQEGFGHSAAETQNALQILTQATGDPAKALDILNTASDLAVAKHESLTAAAGQLGKTYNGAGRLLKEFGVDAAPKAAAATKELESATKGAESADKTAADAKQHLVDLQARLTDSNKTAVASTKGVETAQKDLAKAQEHLADLQKIDAATGKPLTIAQQVALKNATEKVTEATDGVSKAQADYAAAQAKALEKGNLSVTQQQELRNAQDKVTTSSDAAAKAHDKVAAASANSANAAVGQQTVMDSLSQKLSGQASAAADTFGGKLNAMKAKIEDAAAAFGQKYGPAITTAGAALTGLGAAIEIAKTAHDVMQKAELAERAAKMAGTIATGAATAATWLFNAAMDANPIMLVVLALAAIVVAIVLAYEKVGWFRDLVDDAGHVIAGAFNFIKDAVVGVYNWVRDNWPLLVAIILGPFAVVALEAVKHWDAIKKPIVDVFNWIKGNWPLLVEILTGPIGWAAGLIINNWTSIKNAAIDAVNWIKSTWDGMVRWFTGLPGQIANAARGMWDGIKNAFRDAINGIIGLWNRFASGTALHISTPGLPGGIGSFHLDTGQLVPSIGYLAQGGIVQSAMLAVVGEKGPEAVIPLNQLDSRLSGGPKVHIENVNLSDGTDIDLLIRKLAFAAQAGRL
jgi:hypothetical protein